MDKKQCQGKAKRETLLSRSKRIIGKQLPFDIKFENTDSAVSSPTNDTSKRRAQILKAQRTHRRRTQNYIQELEKEVLRLRAREAQILNEVDRQTPSKHWNGDALPSPPDSAHHGISGHNTSCQDVVTIDLTEYSRVSSEHSCVVGATLEDTPKFEAPSIITSIRDVGTYTGAVCGMDAQTAIDFILELERPCLAHIKYDFAHEKLDVFKTTPFNVGQSHACTATATIIHSHQHVDFANSTFHMAVADIEALLEKSRSLPLGPEMTPVQIWALLVETSNWRPIAARTCEALKRELGKYMTCNSFGTTIEIDTLRQVLNYFFPWLPTGQLRDGEMVQATEYGQHQLDEFVGPDWEEFF